VRHMRQGFNFMDTPRLATINAEDYTSQADAPCIRCGELTSNNVAGQKLIGNCCCKKCSHAYFNFLFAHEHRKACYQTTHPKQVKKKQTAEQACNQCSSDFRLKYGCDWRTHLRNVWKNFEVELSTGLGHSLTIDALCAEYKNF
jgi:hypothetical protein